jgi:hypothetical protein
MSTNAMIWTGLLLGLWAGSCWYCYSIGWWKGNTAGVNWSRKQIYGDR